MEDQDDFSLPLENFDDEIRSTELSFVTRADSVLRWFRSCAACHSFFPPIDLLCRQCWAEISRLQNRGTRLKQSGYPFPVYSLFTWNEDSETYVRPLLHAFKGGWALRAARTLSEALVFELTENTNPSYLVYPPSSARSPKDHSWLLANVLAEVRPQAELLRLERKGTDLGYQKGKNAQERTFRRYETIELTEKFSSPETSYVFVDDVITTGSTAMAAYMALGDPDRFAVWSLVSRPKLAGKSTI